ncbi:expressed unknown protein [Seminavis robusta]|uniref:Uncharacterized protein n=1 Tax=Seminavis robusta TaxID=568900 RepID=A0A9N8HS73_9STRA|nr:expressed unknown protein [Seminavis robusta]|eukprot:Sro1355_g265500.1 n/a (458) ;mRNA; f:5051-6424
MTIRTCLNVAWHAFFCLPPDDWELDSDEDLVQYQTFFIWLGRSSVVFFLLEVLNFLLDFGVVIATYQQPDGTLETKFAASLLLVGMILSFFVSWLGERRIQKCDLRWAPYFQNAQKFFLDMPLTQAKTTRRLYAVATTQLAVFLVENGAFLTVLQVSDLLDNPGVLGQINIILTLIQTGMTMIMVLLIMYLDFKRTDACCGVCCSVSSKSRQRAGLDQLQPSPWNENNPLRILWRILVRIGKGIERVMWFGFLWCKILVFLVIWISTFSLACFALQFLGSYLVTGDTSRVLVQGAPFWVLVALFWLVGLSFAVTLLRKMPKTEEEIYQESTLPALSQEELCEDLLLTVEYDPEQGPVSEELLTSSARLRMSSMITGTMSPPQVLPVPRLPSDIELSGAAAKKQQKREEKRGNQEQKSTNSEDDDSFKDGTEDQQAYQTSERTHVRPDPSAQGEEVGS